MDEIENRTRRRHHPTRPAPPPPIPQPPTPPPPTPVPGTLSVADQIAADMSGRNEGNPHGFPWSTGSSISEGNNPGSQTAIEAWGAVYVDVSNARPANTRVNLRGCVAYWLNKSTNEWILGAETNAPEVGSYPEDFSGPGTAADVRKEPDGSISTTAGNGRVSHFYWPWPRFVIDPNNFGGAVFVCQARLILADPSKPDDRTSSKYLVVSGGDYYPTKDGPGIENNPGIGMGNMKYAKNDWRSVAMTTLTKAQLESNPPPINLTGVLP